MSDEQYINSTEPHKAPISINPLRLLVSILKNIYWVILCGFLGWLVAFTYLRYQIPVYQVSSYMLLGGELSNKASRVLKTAGVVEDNAGLVDNEIFILKSYNVLSKVVDSLDLMINVTTQGRIKQKPVDAAGLPVVITVRRKTENRSSTPCELNLSNTGFAIKEKNTDHSYNYQYGQSFVLNGDTVSIVRRDYTQPISPAEYNLQFLSTPEVVGKYQSRLSVVASKVGNGMLEISLLDEFPHRAEKIITQLINEYNSETVAYKNKAIRQALDFLRERLDIVSKELEEEENAYRDFKKQHKIEDVSGKASGLLSSMQKIDDKKNDILYDQMILGLIEKYIRSYDGKEELVPNSIGINDMVLAGYVSKYNELVLKKRGIEDKAALLDPTLPEVEGQLDEMRNNIITNIGHLKEQYATGKSFAEDLNQKYTAEFETLPEVEKQLLEIKRQMNIKESLFTFLLQKKEEISVQLVSANVADSRIVDQPRNAGVIEPQAKKIYLTGITIGLLIPLLILLLIELFNKKVESRKDVEALTNVPIAGEIKDMEWKEPILINHQRRNILTEQYRSLRFNLTNRPGLHAAKTILVTSFTRNEGKSYTSLNLAAILSHASKKTVIIDADFRSPVIGRKLKKLEVKGLSAFVNDPSMNPEEIIHKADDQFPNLYFINSGHSPDHLPELMLSPELDRLFSYLREHFDYIVIDSSPIGILSDAFLLNRFADITLYVVRPGVTMKPTLQFINELNESRKVNNVSIVINGVKSKSYNYGYGYGHTNMNGNGSLYSRIMGMRKKA